MGACQGKQAARLQSTSAHQHAILLPWAGASTSFLDKVGQHATQASKGGRREGLQREEGNGNEEGEE